MKALGVDGFNNPFSVARFSEGYSLHRLGKRLGLSKQYLSRVEAGTYSGLNRELLAWTSRTLELPEREILDQYEAFQWATRRHNAEMMTPNMLARNDSLAPGFQIFSNWRSDYWHSVTAFSNEFCLHPEIVRNYEEGIGMSPTMPRIIRYVLNELQLLDPNWSEGASWADVTDGRLSG